MRGRVIFAFSAVLFRLDTAGTAASPGYDPDFREPRLTGTEVGRPGARARAELPPVRVPCQVEPDAWESLLQTASGRSPASDIALVFHFRDLERLGLVELTTGEPLIRVGDRLGAIHDRAGALICAVATPPGLYLVEARPIGFGLGLLRSHRNLLHCRFESRLVGARRLA